MPHHTSHRVPSRALSSAITAFLAVLILAEPLLIETEPGLQVFQAVFVVWFWLLFMFAGPSASAE